MFEDKINKINKLPGLKKQIQRKAIIAFLEIKHDFPMRRLMMKEKFGQISKGELKLQINGKMIVENANAELVKVLRELIEEELVKISNHGWLMPGKRFKKRYLEEWYNDPGFDFIQ